MLGVIGGSGLYRIKDLQLKREIDIQTPFGKPSAPVVLGKIGEKEVAFLARHGRDHSYPPHLVPYRANLWAMKKAGVQRILSVSAAGSINSSMKPGDYVIIDSFIDFTRRRKSTYFEGKFSLKPDEDFKTAVLMREGKVVHVDMTEPYCPQMRGILVSILEDMKLPYHPAGTYACTEGPRFESTAEIKMLRTLGADVVGMTGVPEVVLARELELCYCNISVVANPAAGISASRLTSDEVIQMMKAKEEELGKIISELIQSLPVQKTCHCEKSLEGAEV